MISVEAVAFSDLLACPRSKKGLEMAAVGCEEALLCPATGVLYPVIDGIVVMEPVTAELKTLCEAFLRRNEQSLDALGDRFSLGETRRTLSLGPMTSTEGWEAEEMAYWEAVFKRRGDAGESGEPNWNRTLPRERLLRRLPISLPEKVVLEIGCGGVSTLSDVYGRALGTYSGLDLSFHACRLARRRFPHGLFIQASVDSIPLREESVDVVVAFGVLHHLPGHEAQIERVLPVLKRGGYFIGSDPMLKPRIPRPRARSRRAAGGTYGPPSTRTGESPHNEWIDWRRLLELLEGRAELLEACFEYGPLRGVLVKTIYDGLEFRSRAFTEAMILLDRIWLGTIGRLHPSLGAAGVIYVFRRLGASESRS